MEPNTPAPPLPVANLSAQVQELAEEVRGETERRERVFAHRRTAPSRKARDIWTLAALAVAIPVLAVLVVATVRGESVLDWFTPAPTAVQARAQAQDAMNFVVAEIDGFKEDYGELPETLVQVAAPTRGQWQYTRETGGHYQVTYTLFGEVIVFDSRKRGGTGQ